MVVLFDFDEVFVDLNSGALKYINDKIGTNYTLKDVTSWDFFDQEPKRTPFFEYLSLPDVYQKHVIPNFEMINVLKQMIEMGVETYIVTASFESSCESKYQFIKEHMSFFDTERLFTVNNSSKYKMKSDVLDELKLNYHQPIVLVDDGIHNILDMMADIKHKDKLDGIMKQFYASRTLKKFNNPYHEFIYGIVPQLPYNQDIVDGKRIFKIKEAKEIWKRFKSISKQHKIRVKTKQAEVFNYLANIVNAWIPAEDFKEVNELQHNAAFLTKSILREHSVHVDFLSEVVRFHVMISDAQSAIGLSVMPQENSQDVSKLVHQDIFSSADKKFGTDVMYQEIKNLIIMHTAKNSLPESVELGKAICEHYKISTLQEDGTPSSLLKTIVDISKDNIEAAKKIVKSLNNVDHLEMLEKLLHIAGMDYDIDFNDRPSLTANAILAFNKNFALDKPSKQVLPQNPEIEEIRQIFLNLAPNVKNKQKM